MKKSDFLDKLDRKSLVSWLELRAEGSAFNWAGWDRILFGILLLALSAHFVLYLYSAYKNMPFPYEFKGWCGDHMIHESWLLSRGQNFYVDASQQVSTAYSYTPIFQFLNAPLVRIFGPQMWTGRVVAVAGLVLVWGLLYLVAARMTGSRIYGLVAAGLLMATYTTLDSHFDDIHPDSWCVGLGLLSLMLSEAALRKNRFWLFPAVLAAVLCYFAKQPGLSFALGAVIYLLINRPRYALAYLAMLCGLLLIGYVIGQILTGGMFWRYTIISPSKLPILFHMIPKVGFFFLFNFSLGAIFVFYLLMDRPRSLPLNSPYLLALPLVFFFYGSASVRHGGTLSSNFFPAMALGAIVVAVALKEVRSRISPSEPKVAFLLLAVLILQNVVLLQNLPKWPSKQHYQTAEQMAKMVRDTPGPVLVYYRIAFAYLNGKEVYDNLNEIWENYWWMDLSRLESQLRQQYFSRILILKKAVDLSLPNPRMMELLQEKYELETSILYPPWYQTTPMLVYRPKFRPPVSPAEQK